MFGTVVLDLDTHFRIGFRLKFDFEASIKLMIGENTAMAAVVAAKHINLNVQHSDDP